MSYFDLLVWERIALKITHETIVDKRNAVKGYVSSRKVSGLSISFGLWYVGDVFWEEKSSVGTWSVLATCNGIGLIPREFNTIVDRLTWLSFTVDYLTI